MKRTIKHNNDDDKQQFTTKRKKRSNSSVVNVTTSSSSSSSSSSFTNCTWKGEKYLLLGQLKRVTHCSDPHKFHAQYNIEKKYIAFVSISITKLDELQQQNPNIDVKDEITGTMLDRGIRLYFNEFAIYLRRKLGVSNNDDNNNNNNNSSQIDSDVTGKDYTNIVWNGKHYITRVHLTNDLGRRFTTDDLLKYQKETGFRAFIVVSIEDKEELKQQVSTTTSLYNAPTSNTVLNIESFSSTIYTTCIYGIQG
jgi:hypothetical protein